MALGSFPSGGFVATHIIRLTYCLRMPLPWNNFKGNSPGSSPDSPGPGRCCPYPGSCWPQNQSVPGTELRTSPGPTPRSQHCLALPGEGTGASARWRGHGPSTPCPCPGSEQGLSWCLFPGKGRGRGQAAPAVALSILPGGFTPKALSVLCRERKYWKISPFCAVPTVSGSAGVCRAGPSASQRPLSPASPKGRAGTGQGCGAAAPDRGERTRSPRGLRGRSLGYSGSWHPPALVHNSFSEPDVPKPPRSSRAGQSHRAHRTLLLPPVLREHFHGADE